MRRALLVAALALATPATAHAASFGELQSLATRGEGCISTTGEPGGLVRQRYGDEDADTLKLVRADATGLHPGATLPIGSVPCGGVMLRASGAGIAAAPFADDAEKRGIHVILREGGTWGAPAEVLTDPPLAGLGSIATAVSDAGAAVIATGATGDKDMEVRVSRRAPGSGFGPAETLFRAPSITGYGNVQAGVSATGETVVAWSVRRSSSASRELWATVAGPGEAFHAPVRIGEPRGGFVLAVGDGGHALVAFASGKQLRVAERGPGAEFGLATPVGVADDPVSVDPAAVMRADGAAVVAWMGFIDGSMRAVTRPGPGAFGPQIDVARRLPLGIMRTIYEASLGLDYGDQGGIEFDSVLELSGTVMLPGDRALVAWSATNDREGVFSMSPQAAILSLAGGPAERHPLGGGLRDTSAIAPLVLADGKAAVAWYEELGQDGDVRDRWRGDESGSGTLHLAVEGVADAADPPAPRVRIQTPKRRVVDRDNGIQLQVTCSAACDVRASAGRGPLDANGELRLRRAGTGLLFLHAELAPLARLDGKPVRVRVRSGAPGARHPQTRTLSVALRRRPGPPLPQVRGVRARRDGDDVVVTWRTDRDADADNFFVYASAGETVRAAEATGSGRRFRARIRDVASARSVTVLTGSETAGVIRRTTVEIAS